MSSSIRGYRYVGLERRASRAVGCRKLLVQAGASSRPLVSSVLHHGVVDRLAGLRVMDIRPGNDRPQRAALLIDDHVDFTPFLPSVGFGPTLSPPNPCRHRHHRRRLDVNENQIIKELEYLKNLPATQYAPQSDPRPDRRFRAQGARSPVPCRPRHSRGPAVEDGPETPRHVRDLRGFGWRLTPCGPGRFCTSDRVCLLRRSRLGWTSTFEILSMSSARSTGAWKSYGWSPPSTSPRSTASARNPSMRSPATSREASP